MNILEIIKTILAFIILIPLALAFFALLIVGGIVMGFMTGICAIAKVYCFFVKGEY